jgi:hypothetical protein
MRLVAADVRRLKHRALVDACARLEPPYVGCYGSRVVSRPEWNTKLPMNPKMVVKKARPHPGPKLCWLLHSSSEDGRCE